MVQLHEDHSVPSFEYVRRLRQIFRERFPLLELSFETGGMISSAINFGRPSPINVQIQGNRLEVAQQIAREITSKARFGRSWILISPGSPSPRRSWRR